MDERYPPAVEERHTLILRGDNCIYWQGRPVAKVYYRGNKGGVKRWDAVCLHGRFAGCHTQEMQSKKEVLYMVWNHMWLEPLI